MIRFVRLSTFLGWAFASIICGAGLLLTSFYLYLTPNLPDAEQLKTTQLQTPLRIYSADNKRIAEFGEKRRNPITIDQVPQNLINAFIAAEDNRFYEHSGIDIKGLLRAAVQLVSSGQIKSGGSTITMQVAKNFFLSRERTFIRKFNEIFLAIQIEQSLSKNEILELYLNKIYLGNRAYGIQAAAQAYYGKNIAELDLAEMTMIAGLPKAPSRYNPLANAKRAKIRRDWILGRMLELGMISSKQHQNASNTPVTAIYHGGKPELQADYAAEMARIEIVSMFGADAYTAGLKAYLTIDSKLQMAANRAIKNGLENYDKRHGFRGAAAKLDEALISGDPDTIINYLQKLSLPDSMRAGLVLETTDDAATIFTEDGSTVELTITDLKWARPFINVDKTGPEPEQIEDVITRGDVISLYPIQAENHTRWILTQTPQVQGALVSIKPSNGAINALVGGYDFQLSHYNRATQAKRQPGSNFKPFIYLAALERGATPATLINDAPIVFEDKNLETAWRPENSSGRFYGPTRLRKALYNSRNLVSIRLLNSTGIRNTINTLLRFGFDKRDLPKDLSLALGSAAIEPIKVAAGYAMIANGGHYVEPYLLDRVEDANGNIIYQSTPLTVCKDCNKSVIAEQPSHETQLKPAPRIADERTIYLLHSMLKDVITKGTGRRAKALKRSDIAGKTGTTNDQKDAWFSGFNTEIATTVWVGFDNPVTLGRREYGARAALPIWQEYMEHALHGTAEAHMRQPEGIVTMRIDPETGEPASPSNRNAIFEIFRKELAPKPRLSRPQAEPSTQKHDSTVSPEDIF